MKISIIGAGNVGSTLADRILSQRLADVVLVDIAEGPAEAKALDISDASRLLEYKNSITGTDAYKEITDSNACVITAGFPRLPGMAREDLIQKNSQIVKSVVRNIKKFSPGAIIIVVTNPLDIMTYAAYKESGCGRKKIIGWPVI